MSRALYQQQEQSMQDQMVLQIWIYSCLLAHYEEMALLEYHRLFLEGHTSVLHWWLEPVTLQVGAGLCTIFWTPLTLHYVRSV